MGWHSLKSAKKVQWTVSRTSWLGALLSERNFVITERATRSWRALWGWKWHTAGPGLQQPGGVRRDKAAVNMREEGKEGRGNIHKETNFPRARRDNVLTQSRRCKPRVCLQLVRETEGETDVLDPGSSPSFSEGTIPTSGMPPTSSVLPVALVLFTHGLQKETSTHVPHVLNLLLSLLLYSWLCSERISSVPYINPKTIGLSINNPKDYSTPQFTI